MNTRETVRHAWQLTQTHLKKLIWYGAVPSFFIIVVSSGYLGYQYNAFRTSEFFSNQEHDFLETVSGIFDLAGDHVGFSITLLVLAITFFVGKVLLPPVFQGIMIQALEKIQNNQDIEGSVEVGVRKFFPMFKFGILTGFFGITTLFTESSFIMRWWGLDAFFLSLPILLFIAVVGFVISFLLAYSEYYIVLEDKNVFRSIMDSAILVIANLRRTFLIFLLMVLIGVQIVLRVILVVLIPILLVALVSYFASLFFNIVGFIIIGILLLAILLISAYLMGLVNIFATAVWVLTFGILRENSPSKKVIVDEQLESE